MVVTASSPAAEGNFLTAIAAGTSTAAVAATVVIVVAVAITRKGRSGRRKNRPEKSSESNESIPRLTNIKVRVERIACRRESELDLLPNDGNRQSGSSNSPMTNVEEVSGDDNVFSSHVAEKINELQPAVESQYADDAENHSSGVPQSQSSRRESLV